LLADLCTDIGTRLRELTAGEPAHPLELGLRLYDGVCHHPPEQFAEIPVLALAMCLSPFDAAIHDAAGQALGVSAFDFYKDPDAIRSADPYFATKNACAAIAETLVRPPRLAFPAWLIFGKNDDIERDVRPWHADRGYRCFKIKIMGKDNAQDVA